MAIRRLTDVEVESVLLNVPLVRVAFVAEVPYVVTLGFAFLDGCLVGQTSAGRKTQLAGKDARVGLQIDTSLADGVYAWRSVQGEGRITFSAPETEILEALRGKFPKPPEWFLRERANELADGRALTFRIEPTLLRGIREGPS